MSLLRNGLFPSRRAAALLAALAILFAFPRATVAAEIPFTIPVVISLTGGAAFLGKSEAQALAILERSVNAAGGIKGRPMHFALQDDGSSPQIAVQLANALVASGAPVILGSDLNATCSAMYPAIKEKAVQYCFAPGIRPAEGGYLFSAGVGGEDILNSLTQYLLRQQLIHVGAIWSNDATGQDTERNMTAMFAQPENKAIKIVANEHFTPTDLSVSAQMSNLKAAGADVCICWTTGAAFGTLLRAHNDVGATFPIATSTGNMTYAQMTQYASIGDATLYFVGFPYFGRDQLRRGVMKTAIDGFYRAFDAAGVKPDSAPGYVWDAGFIVVSAFRTLGTNATSTQIHDYIEHLRGFGGIDGVYDFVANPQRGINSSSAVLTRWDRGKGTWVMVK